MKKVTFIHAADLHLDSPMAGLKHLPKNIFQNLQESTFASFTKIIDAALIHQVDFVILAGDLFDGEDRSIRAQIRFRKEMERLAEKDIPVFAVHGNHDHLEGNWTHLPLPENVHIFSHNVEVVQYLNTHGTTVHLYGFSYPKRHVFERMIDQYTKVEGADFHIGILHGHCEGSSIHGKYAPFKQKALAEKGFDYWALGHIHKRSILSEQPPAVYPGNIQGRNKKEIGRKGCYLIDLKESGVDMEFIDTAEVIWEEKTVNVSEALTFHDICLMCKKAMEESRISNKGTILSLALTDVNVPDQERRLLMNGELLETLQEEEQEEGSFVWISDLTISEKLVWNKDQLRNESDFYTELFKTADEYEDFDESIAPLYEHSLGRKYLESISEEEKSKLTSEAEDLLVNLLAQKNEQ